MATVIGLHQNEWHNDHLTYMREEQPTADLILNASEEEAAAVKGASPNTLVFTRIMEWQNDAHIHNQYLHGDPVAAGQGWAAMALARYGKMGDVVVVLNEPPCNVQALQRQAQAELAFMKALDADGRGLKAGIGGFSGGNLQHPSIDGGAQIRAYEPAFRYAAAHGHKLIIHLYFVRPAMGGATPSGMVYNPIDLALRWTQSIFPWMRANGIPIPDTHPAEFGLDLGFARDLYGFTGEAQGVGWKSPAPWGYGDSEAGARQYAADIVAVATAICRNTPEIKSLLLYCAGDNGTHKWRSFMVDGYLLRHLATLNLPTPSQPQQPPATPPPVPVPVPPTGGNMTLTDRFIQLAQAKWGNKFEDLRTTLPKHATLKFSPIDSRLMQYICFHHTTGAVNTTWKRIAEGHVNDRGFAGIGYHIGVRQGKVALLGDLDTQRAHVLNRNDEALGVAWMGNSDMVNVPSGDQQLLKEIVEILDALYSRDKELTWHGKMLPAGYTECPGSSMKQIVPTLRATVPVPPPLIVDFAKIVWQGEDAMRAEEREGRLQNAEWIRVNWVEPAIRERDKVA